MSHSLRDEIEFELAELHNLLAEHADLFVEAQTAALRRSSITALGGVLHSFYTGIESIFERVEKAYGRPRRGASSWHRDLLEAMAGPGSDRPAVITTPVRDLLEEYLRFRHLYRHSYAFRLEAERILPLVLSCHDCLNRLQFDLHAFLSSLPDE